MKNISLITIFAALALSVTGCAVNVGETESGLDMVEPAATVQEIGTTVDLGTNNEADAEADNEKTDEVEIVAPTARPRVRPTQPAEAEDLEEIEEEAQEAIELQQAPDSGTPQEQLAPLKSILRISSNLPEGHIIIEDTEGNVIADFSASSCPRTEDSYVCEFILPVGGYIVTAKGVKDYVAPGEVFIQLGVKGSSIRVIYDVEPYFPEGTKLASL